MNFSISTHHILVIDDNPGDFLLIKDYLAEKFAHHFIEHAKTFTQAKEKLKNSTGYDTILLDLSLPDASGEMLVNEVVQLAGGTPIIVLTGYDYEDFGIKTMALGIADYLLKDELTAAQLYKSIAYSTERMRSTRELKKSEENYRNLFDLSPIPMWVYNWETYKFLNVNNAAIGHYGYSKSEFLSMTLLDIRPPEDIRKMEEVLEHINNIQSLKNGIYRHLKKNGEVIDVEIHSEIYSAENKSRLVLSNDITVNNYQKNILALEKEVYELNATPGICLKKVLAVLTKNIEQIMPECFCSIMQKNENNTMQILSGGSMPEAYLNAIEGLSIDAACGSCGTAMFTGLNTFVTDIDTDFLWQKYRHVVKPFEFKACWSVPIKKTDGTVTGSFAAYFKTCRHPLPYQVNLLERAASLVGILIENRNAIEDIRKSNERYNIVAKATSDIIWDCDIVSNKVFWNKGLKGILGYNEINDTTSDDWWSQKLHPLDAKRVVQNLDWHINNKIVNWQDEYRFLCGDGLYKYILDRGFLVLDNNNHAVRMIGAMQDITRQKQEEHRLKLLESVITNTSDAVMITGINNHDDKDPAIIFTNEAFTKMTGYTKEEIVGKSPSFLQGPKTNMNELKWLKKAMKNWETCEIEVVNYKKNGEEFWNNISMSPVADSTGSYTHWIAIERDITLRRKKDQEITKAIINAQEHERFQIGGELHDNVNQILAGVLLNLGMTKSKPAAEQSMWIDKSVDYIHMAIEEIRNLSHRLAPVSVDENSLKTTFETLLNSINIHNKYQVNFSIEDAALILIDGDIQLNLYRILQEQLNNIMKYSRATVIDIQLMLVNKFIQLRIYDNGVGFDIKNPKKGIGLNNIKKRTELFSGHFSLKSAPGKGCEIIVEIPVADAASTEKLI